MTVKDFNSNRTTQFHEADQIDRDQTSSEENYEIRVKGHLEEWWSDWFDGLVLTNLENGEVAITGQVEDQAALHGLLAKIRDLNLTLISVKKI
jgi:hypothetical protein